ncbi:hypothetical protein BW737_000705 [Actinomyces ruminis]|uniref:Uncharacterized protein n=1 Tax=Actinomyces ruminis TaxID=1937003 RepID=A0ABX4MED6_9ACTO|nr:hypothetical protein BW737_000705 [Actinomyces ruminis]
MAGQTWMTVPVLPLSMPAVSMRLQIMALRPGPAATKARAASTVGSMEAVANRPCATHRSSSARDISASCT